MERRVRGVERWLESGRRSDWGSGLPDISRGVDMMARKRTVKCMAPKKKYRGGDEGLEQESVELNCGTEAY